jgi:hypothetical protein
MTTNLQTNDGAKFFKTIGAGTSGDPLIPVNSIDGVVTVSGNVSIDNTLSVDLQGTSISTQSQDAGPAQQMDHFYVLTTSADSADVNITPATANGATRILLDLIISVNKPCTIQIKDETGNIYIGAHLAGPETLVIVPRGYLTCKEVAERFTIRITEDGGETISMHVTTQSFVTN